MKEQVYNFLVKTSFILLVLIVSFFGIKLLAKGLPINSKLTEVILGARTEGQWVQEDGQYIKQNNQQDVLIEGTSKYLNFGVLSGTSGYGFRDSSGSMQFKNNSGSWAGIGTGTGTGTGGSSSNSWTTSTNYGVNVSATTTPVWFRNGLMASSTAYLAFVSTTRISGDRGWKIDLSGDGGELLTSDSDGSIDFWTGGSSSGIEITNVTLHLDDERGLVFGSNSVVGSKFVFSPQNNPDTMILGTGQDSNSLIISERDDTTFNFAHPLAVNPSLFIHSANQNATQYLGLYHNQTNAVLEAGTGSLIVSSTANILPSKNNISSLGTFGNAWNNVFASSTIYGKSLVMDSTSVSSTFSNGIDLSKGCFAVNGVCLPTSLGANTSLSNLSSVAINSHLLPDANSTIDLGSFGKAYRNLFVSSTSYLSTTIIALATSTGSIYPEPSNTHDLGSLSYLWRSIYSTNGFLTYVSSTAISTGNFNASGTTTAASLAITGTSGAGFITLIGQASNPTAPAAGTLLLHSSTANGFTRLEQDNEATTNIFLGRDSVTIAKNTSGGTISKGQVVYITGSTGNAPNIAKAKADSGTTLPAIFVVVDDILNNAFGQVMRSGIISNFDTSAFSTGAPVWVSPTTAGLLTATRPSGLTNAVQRIGTILVSSVGAGSLDVQVAPAVLNMETGTIAATWTGTNIVGTKLTSTNVSSTAGDFINYVSSTSGLFNGITMSGNILPNTNNTRDLGAFGLAMRSIFSSTTAWLTNTNVHKLGIKGIPLTNLSNTGNSSPDFSAGESVTAINLVFMRSDGLFWNTDADLIASSTSMLGISLETKTAGQAMDIALSGSFVRNDAWNWTPGVILYVSETAGGLATALPTGTDNVVRVVGYAVTADVIYFYPEAGYITII